MYTVQPMMNAMISAENGETEGEDKELSEYMYCVEKGRIVDLFRGCMCRNFVWVIMGRP